MRPYGVASPAISSRMLSVHGRGATMPTSTMMGTERRATQFVRDNLPAGAGETPKLPVPALRRAVPRNLWIAADNTERARLVQQYVLPPCKPFYTTSLPQRIATSQKLAVRGRRRPVVHVCSRCRCVYLVAFHVPGLRIEALGNVITNTWHCPACNDAPKLTKVDLIGQLVHASNGVFAACRNCASPVLFQQDGLVCSNCTSEQLSASATSLKLAGMRCWNACHRQPVQEIMTIPKEGIDDGEPWPRVYACPVHSLPEDTACRPVPYDHIRRLWWRSRN